MKSKRVISIIMAMVMLMSVVGAVPVSANYSNDEGLLTWDFAEFQTEVSGDAAEYSGEKAKQAAKTEREKPALFAVGASTVNTTETNRSHPERDASCTWGVCVDEGYVTLPETISAFYNCGQAGGKAIIYVCNGAEIDGSLDKTNVLSNKIEIKAKASAAEEEIIPGVPYGLLTNELPNPLNVETPTFGWIVNAEGENVIQTAYRIVMTDDVTGETVWDSGKIKSSEQSYIPYGTTAQPELPQADGYAVALSDAAVTGNTLTKVKAAYNENTEAATVIAAAYNSDGSLAQVASAPLAAGDKNTTADVSFDGALTIPAGGSARVFVWKGDDIGKTMEPISAVFNPFAEDSDDTEIEVMAKELEAGHPYSWKVKTWTKADNASEVESGFSSLAHFATGLSSSDEWNAKWISDGTGGANANEGSYNHFWYVRKSDTLDSTKTVVKATAYISGLQDYDLYVNDTEIGRGQSFDYASESRYQGWDITDAVKSVTDTITVGALVRTYGGGQGRARVNAGFLGHIKVFYTDGTVKTITTDNTWKVSQSVPYWDTKTRNGEGDFVEKYRAANAQDGFTSASFDDKGWTEASDRTVDEEITKPIAELSRPTDYIVHPVSVTKVGDVTVADFGEVIPARPMITFANGTAGKELTIYGGYELNEDGTINTSKYTSQSTDMRWVYTQKAGAQTFKAWDHLGFRYLQIPECGETFTTETIAASVVHTNIPDGRDSTITTSNQMLNDVYELMKRSAIYGVQNEFVDTPTREKGQFTDDARNISEAAMATQFEREATRKALEQFMASADRYWTNDDGTLQGRYNSVYPNIDGKRDIPEYSVNFPQWVWNYYINTGDKATLTKAYPYIKATADYISSNISAATGLVEKLAGGDSNPNDYQYGIVDWPASGRFGYDWSGCKNGAFTTVNMLSKHAFDVVALAAAELGNDTDRTDMENRSAALKSAINGKLRNSDGLYVDGTKDSGGTQSTHISQHANSYAFAFDVIPSDDAKKAAVAKYIADSGMKQGPMTADILAKGLFNAGENTAALKLFTEPNDYGWAREVANGYTFTFESWVADSLANEDSQSHAWGATAASDILKNFAGVTVTKPGASKVRIAPVYVDLTSLDAKVSTERGFVGVSYKRTSDSFTITITIPANMKADIVLPNVGEGTYKRNGAAVERSLSVGSGVYTFTFDGTIVPPEEVVYRTPAFDGIQGTNDAETNTYAWTIGNSSDNKPSYSDKGDYVKLTVGLGSGDSLNENEGIVFGGTAVPDSGGVNTTGRYLLVEPERSGTFTLYATCTGSNNRIYYYNYGTDDADLSAATKNSGTIAANSISKNAKTKTEIVMTAGNKYLIYPYTYGGSSVISDLSYAYNDKEIEITPDGLNKKYMHISFDDVYACLKDITDNQGAYTSVFDNGFFNDLKTLHDTYGAVFTLNCFIEITKDSYDISELPGKYASELAANSDWLKFAFHAQDDKAIYGETTGTSSGTLATAAQAKTSYKKFTDAIMTATGNNEQSIDTVTRLGFFSGSEENIAVLSECDYGITGLLTADDSRLSYYFDTALNSHINQYGYHYDEDKGLKLIKTITRLEGNKEDSSFSTRTLDNYNGNMIEIFTHESEYLTKQAVQKNLAAALEWAKTKGCGFGYAMDLILPPDEQPEIIPNIAYEAPAVAKTVTEPSGTSITLDHDTYPLVVGNASATDFSDWESRGSSFTLTAAVNSGSYTASDIRWSVDDEDIAYIRDNKISGGSTSIRGKRTGSTRAVAALPNGDKAVCYITVIDNVTRVTVNTLELNADTLTLETGNSATLIPIINPKDVYGNGVLDTEIGWASENNNVVTVNDGVVTAVAPGTAKIMAKSNDVGRKAYCTVTVTDGKAPTGIDSTKATTAMTVGETEQLTAEGTELTWKSDNPAVADVDSAGKVTAYSNSNKPKIGSNNQTVFEKGVTAYDEDTVKIYATAKDGTVTTFPVKVSDAERKATDISIYMEDTNVVAGETAEITAAVLPAYAFDKEVTWKSMDENVATVTANGRTVYGVPKATITALKAGEVTIRATCDGQVTSKKITVTDTSPRATVTAASDVSLTIDADEVYSKKLFNVSRPHSAYTYLSTNSDIVTVNNECVIKGYKAGTASIYAIANDSLDASEQAVIDALLETRTIDKDNADFIALLSGVTYAKADIEVVDYTPSLRNLHAPAEARTDTSVNLLWNRASLLDTGDFASYNVYKSADGLDYGSPIAAGITKLGYTAEGLDADTSYHFKVEAVDSEGNTLAEKTVAARTKSASKVINVMDKGAKGDGAHMDTYAIQKAIDEAEYGDTILLPEGKIFLSGALYLKSDITFRVDGILLGSPYDKDYPATITRWEGWRRLYQTAAGWGANSGTDGLTENVHPHASLLNAGTYDEGTPSYTGAYNVENLTICGKGMINANGFRLGYNEGINQKSPQPSPMTPAMNQTVRGRAITLHNADKVYIKDVTVSYSPSWTIHPIFCRNLTVDGVDVVSAGDGKTGAADDITILNGDGIDPDSSTMVNLFNMDFQTGDDGVAIKTGKDKEGNMLDKPCAYIRVTDCYSHDSKGGIVIGSENASGTHDALLQNLKVTKTTLNHTIWLKGCWSRGGITHDLLIRDIDGVDKFDIQTTYNTPTNNPADTVPQYKYITFENCSVSFTAKGFNHGISGLSSTAKSRPETYLENFTIRGCQKGGSIDYAKSFTIIDPEKESNWSFGSHAENMNFVYSDSEASTKIKVKSNAAYVSAVDNDKLTITAATGTTEAELLADIEALIPDLTLGYSLSADGKTLTVTAKDGTTTANYTVSYATIWNFSEYTTEVKLTADGVAANYNGLEITLAGNGADSDHDKITTAGVYWRGGASSGNSARYIKYTPAKNGTLTVTGKLNASSGRLGISTSLDVSLLKDDGSSTTSTSAATFQKECVANTTYYIIPKGKSATISTITYTPAD